MGKLFYIKERHNPQFKKPYYIPCGQLTKAEAKRMENSIYGYNLLIPYQTEEAYNQAIAELKAKHIQENSVNFGDVEFTGSSTMVAKMSGVITSKK